MSIRGDRNQAQDLNPYSAALTEKNFNRLRELIYSLCGIKLIPAKKTMLEGRLRKRLRALGINSFDSYCNYLLSDEGMSTESVHMVDVVTTNKTDFFREPDHFDYLSAVVLPDLARSAGAGHGSPLSVWSAGCSTGEEPYTLAMVLSEYGRNHPGFNFRILGTDISTKVLEIARRGIYDHDRISPVPMPLRRKYLLRSRDRTRNLVRIAPELRSLVSFRRLNFMESDFGIREHIDVIFCRNVLIYFDKETQERVLQRFCRHLSRGGYLFTGHSETLQNMRLPLIQATTTVYKKI